MLQEPFPLHSPSLELMKQNFIIYKVKISNFLVFLDIFTIIKENHILWTLVCLCEKPTEINPAFQSMLGKCSDTESM
jgi:hypothetical protein